MTGINFIYFFHFGFLWIGCIIVSVQASCESNPCKNGGMCTSLPNGDIFCICPRNFTGSFFCDPITSTPVPSVVTSTRVLTSRLSTTNQPIKLTERVDNILTSRELGYPISRPRLMSELLSTYRTILMKQTTDETITTKQASTTASQSALIIGHDKTQQQSSTKPSSLNDVTREQLTKVLSVFTNKNPTEPTKALQTKEWNFNLWFTWLVILLFVTSVLLLLLAIALFISYGRANYSENEENDSHDYPPEEDDLVGRKQVFTLNFRN